MNKWINGQVEWFDKLSGVGEVRDINGDYFQVHYSAIGNRRNTLSKKNAKRVHLEAGEEVKFRIYENLYSKRVSELKSV